MKAANASVRHMKVPFKICILLTGAAAMSAAAQEAAKRAENPATQTVEREGIPGADRMPSAERDTYRRRMEAAATPEEKARIRAEYAKAADAKAADTKAAD